ncbi:WXG100 family type VII secretion target [Nocardia gamkensis]|uniref:WXG100 family type VII secretion target n=1 Tax=Nocardia gamkensis TaxID=352869 RepID=UPI0037C77F16
MESSDYRVDLAGMQALVDQAADLEKRIDDRVRDIQSRIADLHINWTGRVSDAHRAAATEWASGAAEMNAALGELRQALGRARSVYHSVGQTNVGMWPR